MKLTFLGTGAGVPAKERNVSSVAFHLMNKAGSIWLFDCGEGTQQQILRTSIKLRRIERIFITHLHGDHIFGLPGLLGSRSFQGGVEALTIYGPRGIKEFVETAVSISGTYLKYPLHIEEIDEEGVLLETGEFTVSVGLLSHGIPSYGFRIKQKDMPGPLLMEKIKAAGVPAGPHLGALKQGEIVTLPDGRTIDGKDYVGPSKKGKVVAILGDTLYSEKAVDLTRNADMVIHEATFGENEDNLAVDYFHSTTVQAATVAKLAGARSLILNHISSRYQKEDIGKLLEEAQVVFSNTAIAEDFSEFDVK
ncbi:MAG: ribonuclease Z [Bacillus sp. (in: Bacteria)]|nr:ribonuclease Z [Bacillus sp. (in: firmicutes)]